MVRIFLLTTLQLAGLASILGLYLTIYPWAGAHTKWHIVVIAIIAATFIYTWWHEVKEAIAERHKSFKNDADINAYMCRWISNRGQALVLSRDMSWGSEPKTKVTLLTKANKRELTVFMKHETELSKELSDAGAEIIYYGKLGFNPKSRFTIIGHGKDGSRVAVGTERQGRHIVYEYAQGEHPIAALSDDITEILRRALASA